MSSFRARFPQRHVFLPVIHTTRFWSDVRKNVIIARDSGADGVFLINHATTLETLIDHYHEMRSRFPDVWCGVNVLGANASINIIPNDAHGIWEDDAGITDMSPEPDAPGPVSRLKRKRARGFKGIYFGGVAFKYVTPQPSDPARAAAFAMPYVDVITTTGDATGSAPSVAKIRTMKEAIGDHPLAIASGMTPENVGDYLPYADCFLVATGISKSDTELDPKKTRAFAKALKL
jgi:uncharacterized protein